jgi:hypothetical protein
MPFFSRAVAQKIVEIPVGSGIGKKPPAQNSSGLYQTRRGPLL